MSSMILRSTRASAAHLATAQRHASTADRLRQDAERVLSLSGTGRYRSADAKRFLLAEWQAKVEEADRLDRLAARAMARHEAARAILG